VRARFTAFFGRWYFAFALALWVFSPELRRFIDWQSSFHKLSLLSVLPLAGMLPGLLLLAPRWKRLGPLYRLAVAIWLGTLAYAFFIGFFSGSRVSALYDAVIFSFPLLAGVFLAVADDDLAGTYERFSGALLWLAAISSLYGIYQYVSPPPWDVYWVQNSGLVSTGQPVPFGLRAFGTLNAYAAFAHFLSFTLVINLPRLRLGRPLVAVLFVPCAIALILTLDRTAWLSFSAGTLLYVVFSPQRRNALVAIGSAALFCAVIATGLIFTIKGASDAVSDIQQRFSTLGNLSDDYSLQSRELQTDEAYHQGFEEPLGQGLGSVGTAAVASNAEATNTLDNGYLSRFVEFGVVGFPAYLFVLGLAFVGTFRAYRASLRAGDPRIAGILAMAVAVQAMLVGTEFSGDSHDSLPGLFFWATFYFGSSYLAAFAAKRAATAGEIYPALRPAFGAER